MSIGINSSLKQSKAVIGFTLGSCYLGDFLVAQSKNGICAVFLGDNTDALLKQLRDYYPDTKLIRADSQLKQTLADVAAFIEHPQPVLTLPLDIQGTAFQRKVWKALLDVSLGTTVSYSMLAKQIGQPTAIRAIASACAANSLAILIPCHRVIKQNGELSGYRWGTERKRAILLREQAAGFCDTK